MASNNAFTLQGATAQSTASGAPTGNQDLLGLLAQPTSNPNLTLATAAPATTSQQQYSTLTPAATSGSTSTAISGALGSALPKTAPTTALNTGATDTASVKQLQDYLVSKGIMTQDQVNTGYGIYGPQTTAAVAKLQQQLGVDTSGGGIGTYGPLTMAAVQKAVGTNTTGVQQTGLLGGSMSSSGSYTSPNASIPSTQPQSQIQNSYSGGTPNFSAAQTPQQMALSGANGTPTNQNTGILPGTTGPQPSANPTGGTQGPDLSRGGIIGSLVGATTGGTNQNDQRAMAVNKQIADLRASLADQTAGINNEGIPLEFKQGRGQVLQTQEAQKEAALASQLGYYSTARGQDITGLSTAAGLSQPFQVSPGNSVVQYDAQGNPVQNNALGGLGSYANFQTAQQVMGASSQYKDAVNAQGQAFNYDPAQSPQANWQNFQQNYLPNSRTYQSGLVSSGLPSNIGSGSSGSPFGTSAATQGYQQQYSAGIQSYNTITQQLQNVDGLGGLLVTTADKNNVNPLAPQFANQTISEFRRQLSSDGQARFDSTLAAFQGAASQLLTSSSGQTPTGVTSAISGIANGSLQLSALKALVDQAKQEGTIKLTTAQQQAASGMQGLNGSGTTSSSNTMFGSFF